MKFYTNQLPQLLNKIANKEIKSLLLYGHDSGFIHFIINQLVKKFNFFTVNLTIKEAVPANLETLGNNNNFWGQVELLKIEYNNSGISKELKEFLLTGNFTNFLCFVCNDSLPSSGIRKLFEDTANLAIMPCYYQEENTVASLASATANNHGKKISQEALAYIKATIKGDYQLIVNELDKLIYYTHDKNQISYEDAKAALSDNREASGDEMCIFFGKKQPELFLKEIQRLKNEDVNEVLIIRTMLRYYINLFIVVSHISEGENIDSSIKSLTTPIFFKYINHFKQIAQITSINDIIRIIKILYKAELKFKTNSKDFDFFTDIYLPAYLE